MAFTDAFRDGDGDAEGDGDADGAALVASGLAGVVTTQLGDA